MPPNIILVILAFFFVNSYNNDRYDSNYSCDNIASGNNFNLVVILILIIIYYSNSNSQPDVTKININRNSNRKTNKHTKKQNEFLSNNNETIDALSNPLISFNQNQCCNIENYKQIPSKHTGKQEGFTYANKVVKPDSSSKSLSRYINNDYQGAAVTAILSNKTTVTGEVIFTFNDVVSLKTKDNIIFVNAKDIVSFF